MVRPPELFRKFFPSITWRIVNNRREVYLTFDDGPIPEITPAVLEILNQYNVKATFFCIGENVRKHPGIYQKILAEGHRTGNHTQHHLNAWKVKQDEYLDDISRADTYIDSNLFRPPYGKITPAIINRIKAVRKIVLWDVISYDFDQRLTEEEVYRNIVSNLRPGSIIVMHDSIKAGPRILGVLPQLLKYLRENEYECAVIPD